jgi:hypothetical protein
MSHKPTYMSHTMNQRAVFLIEDDLLDQFNRSVPARTRSKIISSLMREHISRRHSGIENAARLIEADPSYAEMMQDSDALTAQTFNRLETHE